MRPPIGMRRLDGLHNTAEDVTDGGSEQGKDHDDNDSDQDKDQRIFD